MNSLWQTLLKYALETEADELSCAECFDLLDLYAEILADGGDPSRIMPKVRQYLKHCDCCEKDLETQMSMMQDAAKMPSIPSSLGS